MDRIRGCIIGGVIGDAMGGQPGPLRFQEHTARSISDDSQLTLAGAWIRASSIPQNLIASLPRADETVRIVDEFAATV